jgi:hypothetical protein
MSKGAAVLAFVGGLWGMFWGFAMLMMYLAWHDYEPVFLSLDTVAMASSIAAFTGVALVDSHRVASSTLMLVPGLLNFAVAGFFLIQGLGVVSGFFWSSAIPGIMLVGGAMLEAASGRKTSASTG